MKNKAPTEKEINEAFNMLDMALRPNAIICYPGWEKWLESQFGKEYKIIPDPNCPPDKCYLISREVFEKNFGGIIP